MKTFRFPLEKALDWRRTELDLEEALCKRQSAELAGLDSQRAEIEASGLRAEIQVRTWNPVGSGDLVALGFFRRKVKTEQTEIARRRDECAGKLTAQKQQMLEARRRCRLLERLKERRLAEWTSERDRELEQIAAESYLARWRTRSSEGPRMDTNAHE